jgi:iron complex transport system ATP-binding protein
MEALVSVKGVGFSYGGPFRLKDVSFTVGKGEVLVLLGPNGCGKTTLLKCINALLSPSQGEVDILGKNIRRLSRAELARLIGFVPQTHSPPFPYTVLDVVLMGRASHMTLFQQPSHSDYIVSEEALGLMGVLQMKDRIYTQISGGERQLVLIARAIAQEPKVLLLDEPTAHLDFKNQQVVLRMVKRIATEKGLGVVMSLHDPNHALSFSDKVVLIGNGRVSAVGAPLEVVTPDNIRDVYSIETKMLSHENGNILIPME